MKFIITAFLFLAATSSYAHDECRCKALAKVCTLQSNGTQKNVYISVYNSEGDRVAHEKLAHGLSLEDALAVLNSRACN